MLLAQLCQTPAVQSIVCGSQVSICRSLFLEQACCWPVQCSEASRTLFDELSVDRGNPECLGSSGSSWVRAAMCAAASVAPLVSDEPGALVRALCTSGFQCNSFRGAVTWGWLGSRTNFGRFFHGWSSALSSLSVSVASSKNGISIGKANISRHNKFATLRNLLRT